MTALPLEEAGSPDSRTRTLVEICVDDLAGVLAAERAGADRVELCANLLEGGTTPSPGMVEQVLASVTRVGVQIMVRARGGDFVYSPDEMRVMLADARAIAGLSAGSTVRVGIVFGALLPDGRIDEAALDAIIEAAKGLPVTFHKAFDETPDPAEAYETLARHGVECVLTSGGAATAAEGAGVLSELVARSSTPGSPRVLMGGSVRAHNVADLLEGTGAGEVHLRAQVPSERGYLVTDEGIVSETVASVRATGSPRLDPTPTPPSAPAVATTDRPLAAYSASPVPGAHVAVPAVLAIDVGGTSAKGAVVDASGRVRSSLSVATGGSGDETLRRIRLLLVDLAASAASDGLDVVGAGVVSPGLIDTATGTVRYASTLGWTDMPLGRILGDAIGIPVAVGHDVRAAGSAEMAFGSAAGSRDALFAAIGTGVAASIVSDGRAIDGAIAGAGELGHIPVAPNGEQCTCGQTGCLEVYFSGAGLARRYAAALTSADGSAAADGSKLSAAEVVARIGTDPLAARVWSEGLDALATGLATITLLIDPEVIVLGGGVAQAGDTLLAPLRERLSASLVWRDAPRITTAALGTEAGRIGAAMLGFRAAHRSEVPLAWTRADILASPLATASSPLETPVAEMSAEKEEVRS